jgi:predicted ATP-grasp superfamily ATP-dependent carboligase
MKVLITSVRLPFGLDIVRKFGEEGHEVCTAETFKTAPGSHSKFVKEHLIVPSPTFETRAFIDKLKEIIASRSIELLVPCFEDVFYISKHLDELSQLTHVFCAPLETLMRLHNKANFTELTQELGIPIPKTTTVRSQEELKEAVQNHDTFFARATFSRGGVELFTNTGPLAGQIKLEDCHPSPQNPWLVQDFVQGKDLCSYSTAHHGKIVAHSCYEHEKTIEHAGGIAFKTVDEPQSFEFAREYIEGTGYHGQISFDYMKTDHGLSMVECNPRPTAGLTMMSSKEYIDAVLNPDPANPVVIEEGRREQIDVALIRDMFREPKEIPHDLHLLLSGTRDVYTHKDDLLPGLYQILSYTHVIAFRHKLHVKKHRHSDIMAAQFYDISYDGQDIQ